MESQVEIPDKKWMTGEKYPRPAKNTRNPRSKPAIKTRDPRQLDYLVVNRYREKIQSKFF